MKKKRISTIVILLFVSALGSGCAVSRDFKYEPRDIAVAPKTSLRIAVLPFSDKRKTQQENSLGYTDLPLVPYGKKIVDAPQSTAAREQAEYYYPDLIAYALAQDLRHNGVADVVHVAPALIDDYDLVVMGNLDAMPISTESYTYGLGRLSALLGAIAVPSGSNSVDITATYRVSPPNGEAIYADRLTDSYSRVQWAGKERGWFEEQEKMDAIIKAMHNITELFIEQSASSIQTFATQNDESSRRFNYYYSLDPELPGIENALQRHQNSGNRRAEEALLTEYQRRLNWLERYRKKEWQILTQQQDYKAEIFEQRLETLAKYRGQKRDVRKQELVQQNEYRRAKKKQFYGALAGALLPAAQATRNNAGQASAEILGNLVQDTSSAVAAIPKLQAPTPIDPALKNFSIDMTGLSGVGSDPFAKVQGKSLREIRQRFLQLYRSKARNVARYL